MITDEDSCLLNYFLHSTLALSALATPPFTSLYLLCESLSSEPIVTPCHEHKFENWGAGCSAGRSLSPIHVHPVAVRLHRPRSPSLFFCFEENWQIYQRKKASFVCLKDNTMVNTANLNTDLVPSLLFP